MSRPPSEGLQRPGVIRFTTPILRVLFRLYGGLRVEGLENLPRTGGAIIAPNHLSWADPPALRTIIRRRCFFMANHDLFDIPVIGRLLPMYGTFPIDRNKHPDREALRAADKHLREGDLLCIFPEGGTTVTGTLVPFEGGVALLALRNHVPVVPVAITGSDRMLPREPPLVPHYTRGGMTVTFGRPIHPDEIDPRLAKRERVSALTRRLQDAVAAMLPPEYLPPHYWQRPRESLTRETADLYS